METATLIESFAEFANFKNIDRPTMIHILEEVFKTMIRKKYETDENFDVIINVDKGDLEIWRYREIVGDEDEEFDENLQIRLSDAKKIEPDFEVGEEAAEVAFFAVKAVEPIGGTHPKAALPAFIDGLNAIVG